MTNILDDDLYDMEWVNLFAMLLWNRKVLNEKRRYTKLIEVLRDVGGFMEVMLFIFKIISFFSANILYEKSLLNWNCLFEFDLNMLSGVD